MDNDSFEAFRQDLNQRPQNTRSSLIETQDRNNEASTSQRTLQGHSRRYVKPISSYGSYNTSGRPLNLSDFKNDSRLENNYSCRIYDPSNPACSRRNISSIEDIPRHDQLERSENFVEVPYFYQGQDVDKNYKEHFLPYEESGRTFNLTDFAENPINTFPVSMEKSEPPQTLSKDKTSRQDVNISVAKTKAIEMLRTKYSDNKERVFKQSTSKRTMPKMHPHFDSLVKDTYFPGIITDAVNGQVDFNKSAFDFAFQCENIPQEIDDEKVPMSLLEAFELRINHEKDLRDDLERRKYFCSEAFQNEQKNVENQNDEKSAENQTYWTHRDELKLASTIDIDLMSRMSKYPESPLTEAINCLLRAEKMNNYDRNVHYAEEAIRTAPDGQKELAALKSTCSFKLDLRKDEAKATNSYERLAIMSYIGTTQPTTQ